MCLGVFLLIFFHAKADRASQWALESRKKGLEVQLDSMRLAGAPATSILPVQQELVEVTNAVLEGYRMEMAQERASFRKNKDLLNGHRWMTMGVVLFTLAVFGMMLLTHGRIRKNEKLGSFYGKFLSDIQSFVAYPIGLFSSRRMDMSTGLFVFSLMAMLLSLILYVISKI